jgi:hypothetical protein
MLLSNNPPGIRWTWGSTKPCSTAGQR